MSNSLVVQNPVVVDQIPDSCFQAPPKPNYDGKIFDECRDIGFYVTEAGNANQGNSRIIRFSRQGDKFLLSENNTPENTQWFNSHPDKSKVWEYLKKIQDPQHPWLLERNQRRAQAQQEGAKRGGEAGFIFNLEGGVGQVSTTKTESKSKFSQTVQVGFSGYDPNGWGGGIDYQWIRTPQYHLHSAKPFVGYLTSIEPGDFGRITTSPLIKLGPVLGARETQETGTFHFQYGAALAIQVAGFSGIGNLWSSLIGLDLGVHHVPETGQVHFTSHATLNVLGGISFLSWLIAEDYAKKHASL